MMQMRECRGHHVQGAVRSSAKIKQGRRSKGEREGKNGWCAALAWLSSAFPTGLAH